jgi:hypothetical protein
MSDSIKKHAEMQEQPKYITDELIEERLTMKGFSEQDSHDEEHVFESVCKHFDLTFTDVWKPNLDYYIYEESTADGYTVNVCTHDFNSLIVSENIYYHDNELTSCLVQAIIDADHGDAEIYLSALHDHESWIQDAMSELYVDLYKLYVEEIEHELIDEGYSLKPDASMLDVLNLIANND